MDGLKISLRKILFAAFKEAEYSNKVAQFKWICIRTYAYHGEQSLNGAIVKMAQDFIGSNNINLLILSRRQGSASEDIFLQN